MTNLVTLNLAGLRERRGLTQVALSSQIDITQKQISAIERGDVTRLELATIWKICMFFNCTPNDLLSIQKPEESSDIRDARRLIANAKARAKKSPTTDRTAIMNRFDQVRKAIAERVQEGGA
jgi:DNA-binding Xre family transcriptional regulator